MSFTTKTSRAMLDKIELPMFFAYQKSPDLLLHSENACRSCSRGANVNNKINLNPF